jgi:hypothetical protein
MSAVPAPSDGLEPTEHAAAEGVEASGDVGSTSSLREMLLASDPNPDLEEVDTPWDVERGGRHRIYRGIQKALDYTGMPAIVDVVVGALEELHRLNLEDDSADDGDQEQSDDAGDATGDPLAGSPVGGA